MANDQLTPEQVRQAFRTLADWARDMLNRIEEWAPANQDGPVSIDELAKWMYEKDYLRDDFATDQEFKDFLKRLHKADLQAQERK
jgi:hypothetical protein